MQVGTMELCENGLISYAIFTLYRRTPLAIFPGNGRKASKQNDIAVLKLNLSQPINK